MFVITYLLLPIVFGILLGCWAGYTIFNPEKGIVLGLGLFFIIRYWEVASQILTYLVLGILGIGLVYTAVYLLITYSGDEDNQHDHDNVADPAPDPNPRPEPEIDAEQPPTVNENVTPDLDADRIQID